MAVIAASRRERNAGQVDRNILKMRTLVCCTHLINRTVHKMSPCYVGPLNTIDIKTVCKTVQYDCCTWTHYDIATHEEDTSKSVSITLV